MRKPKKPPGTWIEREMFLSPAYLNLKGFAPQLLTLFLSKREFARTKDKKGNKQYQCLNPNSICFTFKEAEKKHGIPIGRFNRAIRELLAKGFISLNHQGGAYRQDKSIYALSDKWILWQPGKIFEVRKRDVKRGFQNGKKSKKK